MVRSFSIVLYHSDKIVTMSARDMGTAVAINKNCACFHDLRVLEVIHL